MYASAKTWCSAEGLKAAIPYWQSLCETNSLTLMDLTGIEANVTDDCIASLPLIDPEQNSTTTTGTINSSVTHDFAIAKDKMFGWGIMGYWANVLVFGMFSKAWTVLQGGSQRRSPLESLYHRFRTHITVPATFVPLSSRHQQLWYSHAIPKRVDSLIVFGFWAVTIILSFVKYESFTGNIETPSLVQKNWQYSSDRTGILSYACLPFLWLFSGRNNIFLWATNFTNQSFITFHRHVAWACTLLAAVHSINYSVVFAVYDGRYWTAWIEEYWYMGVVATILMCFMLVQSMTWFRQHSYEVFLAIHLVFAVVVIVGLFMHTSFDGLEFVGYLWAPVGLWIIDRLARVFRIFYCNLNVRFGKQFFSKPYSTVTYSEESDLIKIEVIPGASTTPRPKPGQHYFLYQGGVLKFWENHPFSLGAWAPALEGKSEFSSPAMDQNKLIFYIRPYDGGTRRLRDQCRKANDILYPNLLVEGPYGHTEPMHHFDTNLMVVGGTGIAAALPYLLSHLERVKRRQTKTSRIHLVWSIRQREMWNQVFTDDLLQVLQSSDITITIYCSNLATTLQDLSSAETDASNKTVLAATATPVSSPTRSGGVRFMPGRPNVRELLMAEVEESKASTSSIGVFTCGPAQMADECRSSVYEVMKHGFHAIDYFEEAFGW
ncbi:FAD-binding 8 [Penicillium canescens]|uniref:FAD-binding 8 n=1 Tax=Penicillium canescens TaxID=5083 RepID=A0AAD6I2F3_PENCN|nr:FAD-binding 8 [Penicillium canescens]KAJ6027669.1 FAD-binding 8 [Penicillium canescens]KAJ6040947.1 FAD-binding 8 [Penicillium canescens]KAJ6066698.1 FAD-binding 8 [Penicillium canescens]